MHTEAAGEEDDELLLELKKKHNHILASKNEILSGKIDSTVAHAMACGLFPSDIYDDTHTVADNQTLGTFHTFGKIIQWTCNVAKMTQFVISYHPSKNQVKKQTFHSW